MILGKYNKAKTITFDLFAIDGIDLSIAATFAAGDVKIMKDEGVEANTTNLPTDEGSTYSLVLTATEMSAARIRIILIDQTATKVWLDISIGIETYGNASAEHALDLDDAVRGGMTALPNAAADAAGGLAISDAGGLSLDALNTAAVRLTAARAQVLDDWINAGRLDLILDIIAADTADIRPRVVAIEVDTSTTLDTKINDIQGSTFNSVTDSLESIRDRGDAAWTTGAGGSDRLLLVDTTIATLASQTSFTLTAGSADNTAYDNCTIVVENATTATQKSIGVVLSYTGLTKTITLKEAPAFTIAAADKIYILAENSLKSTIANRQLDVTATGATGVDWANVENPTTVLDLAGTNIQLCDTVTTNTDMRGTELALLAANINLTGGAVDTVTTLTNKTGFSLAATGLDAIVSTATGMIEIAKAIWDRVLNKTNHNISKSAGKRLRKIDAALVITDGTAQAGAASTITLAATESATNEIFTHDRIVIVGGTGVGEHGIITAYNGTTKVATMDQNWVITPDATSEYEIEPAAAVAVVVTDKAGYSISGTKTTLDNLNDIAATAIVSAGAITTLAGAVVNVDTVDVTTTNTDMRGTEFSALASVATEARLSELDAVTAGKLANQMDIVQTDTTTDIPALIAAVKGDTAAILIDTTVLQTEWADGGRLDLIIDAILNDTGTSGVVLTAAERNSIADALLDRNMGTGTDSGSATVRTVRQALRANRNKVSIASGIMTVTKEDDMTASWTAAITTTAGDPISEIDPA